jgi:hypothetical protein
MRGKYVARRLRGQPGHRSAPDGSRFDYIHVIAAGAPHTPLSRHRLKLGFAGHESQAPMPSLEVGVLLFMVIS